ncbi:hypothetical protein C4F49_09145 [Sphingobacterium sp. KB22]|uniref:HTH luxR-type domain-containing protein n=1 Tax=Sphingobacterium hungaricum TaxID=2082723 RepID=A0A928UV92_9SPHI|nr:hypothetical protein [Sphingobacterium hungaricum]
MVKLLIRHKPFIQTEIFGHFIMLLYKKYLKKLRYIVRNQQPFGDYSVVIFKLKKLIFVRWYLVILFSKFSLVTSANSNVDDAVVKLEYARFCLNNLNDIDKAISLYNELVPALVNSGNDSLRLVAETERIELLQRTGQRIEMLSVVKDVESLAIKLNDYEQLSHILTLKGLVYSELGFKNEALKAINKASENINSIQDEDKRHLNIGYIFSVRANIADSVEDKIFHLLNGYKSFMKVNSNDQVYRNAQITGNSMYASAFIERKQLDSASFYLSKSISYIDSNQRTPDDYYALINFANLHYQKQDYPEAEQWFLRALMQAEKENNLHRLSSIYYYLFKCKSMQNQAEFANNYLIKYVSLQDSFEDSKFKNISFVENELTVDKSNELIKANKRQKSIIIGFSGVTILLCLTIGKMLFNRKKRNKPFAIKPIDTLTRQEDRDVSVEEINFLNNLVKRNDPSFILKFHEVFPEFSRNVNEISQVPLTHSEIEICAYTKLNFSTKEIALYRKDTIRSVENRKYRIRKKLMLTPETDFVVWVANVN